MKKILIIHHGQGVGGGLIALIGLINELKENNNVEVFSIFDGIAVEYLRKTGVSVIVSKSVFYRKFYSLFIQSEATYINLIEEIIKFKALIAYFLNKYFFAGRELKDILQGIDLVYLNSTFISDWAYAAKKSNKNVIIHVREPLSNGFFGMGYNIIRNNISKYCDKIIAISKDNCGRVNLENKTTIIYDPVVIENRNAFEKLNIIDKYKYFVYVGGQSRIKGFEQFVNSLKYLNEDVKIFFLGGEIKYNNNSILKKLIRNFLDPYARNHENLKKILLASKNIVYIGLTDNVFYFYNRSICLISPFSKSHASLPVLEAFSNGIPVIVSDVKGSDEFVNHSNGFFFENKNPQSLANRINEMSRLSSENYKSMKNSSYETYLRIRKNEIKVQSLIDIL
ncbi:MAG: glycosyltransferase family 4 protein [Lutibacter sp.]|nr:glycosyltransferase family 4 protein [Lutibacter sp.]